MADETMTGFSELVMEPLAPGAESTDYWRDDAGVHHVPKRAGGRLVVAAAPAGCRGGA